MTEDAGTHPRRPRGPAGRPPAPAARPFALEPQHLYKAIGLFFLLLVLYSHFDAITRVLLIVFASAILAVALNVLVEPFSGHRRLASVVLGVGIFGAIALALWFAVPALGEQLRGLSSEIPRFQAELERWGEWLRDRTGLNVQMLSDRAGDSLAGAFGNVEILGSAVSVLEGLFLPLVIIIGSVYAVARPNERLLNPLLRIVPADRRDAFRRLFELLGSRLRGWVRGTLIAMVVVGILTWIGLFALGVRYSLLLAVIAGSFEVIPIIGAWAAGAAAVGVALIDDPTKAVWVAGLMLVIQQLESNLITPIVMSRSAEVHPFVTLFALFLFGSIFGFLGLLLAVPIVLLVWTVMEVLWVEQALGADEDRIEPIVHE